MASDTDRFMLYDARKKETFVAYLIWFVLGAFGIHRFYLGRSASGLVMLILTVLGGPILVAGLIALFDAGPSGRQGESLSGLVLVVLGTGMLVVICLWWIIDAFLTVGMVERYNSNLARTLSAGPTPPPPPVRPR